MAGTQINSTIVMNGIAAHSRLSTIMLVQMLSIMPADREDIFAVVADYAADIVVAHIAARSTRQPAAEQLPQQRGR